MRASLLIDRLLTNLLSMARLGRPAAGSAVAVVSGPFDLVATVAELAGGGPFVVAGLE